MRTRIRRVRRAITDRGASAVEYGLMVAAVAAVIVGVVFGFGHILDQTFTKSTDCIREQGAGDPFPNCPTGPNP
jgi:pilus assembly protein Flp/PilA